MKRTYSRQEKDLVFDLWKQGAGFRDIARVLDAQLGVDIYCAPKARGNKARNEKATQHPPH